jgi:hypothetical protein
MTDNFMKRNWLGLLGLVAGLAGITLAVYFYHAGRATRIPIFIEDPVRTEILSQERIADAPIRVFRSDGQEVVSDLMSTRFYIWNDGKAPIRSEHVLKDILITLDGDDDSIVDFRLQSISRDVTELSLSRHPSDTAKTLELSFKILEQYDGATGQIIYEGNPQSKLVINGTIEGVTEFRASPENMKRQDWYKICFVGIGMLGNILVLTTFNRALRQSTKPILVFTPTTKITIWIGAALFVFSLLAYVLQLTVIGKPDFMEYIPIGILPSM